jgi:hypothetical protein
MMRAALLAIARRCRRRQAVMSFCGPLTMVTLVACWAAGLVVGSALVLHPMLGGTVVSSTSDARDFIAAMYAGSSALAINGSAELLSSEEP